MPFQSWSNGAMKKKQPKIFILINNVGIFLMLRFLQINFLIKNNIITGM